MNLPSRVEFALSLFSRFLVISLLKFSLNKFYTSLCFLSNEEMRIRLYYFFSTLNSYASPGCGTLSTTLLSWLSFTGFYFLMLMKSLLSYFLSTFPNPFYSSTLIITLVVLTSLFRLYDSALRVLCLSLFPPWASFSFISCFFFLVKASLINLSSTFSFLVWLLLPNEPIKRPKICRLPAILSLPLLTIFAFWNSNSC